MDKNTDNIINIFSALAQPTRLAVFQLLVQHQPAGLAAGEIARALSVPHNTLSVHLAVMARADLVLYRRNSRHIIYQANIACIADVMQFLLRDCCHNDPSLCASLNRNIPTDLLNHNPVACDDISCKA